MSKGDLNINYNTDSISISSFPLTAGIVCAKILNSFEKIWNIIEFNIIINIIIIIYIINVKC